MSETTAIEWADSTFNPWIGCTRVSPACDDCYAARSTPARALGVAWGPKEERRRTGAENWKQPLRWNAGAAEFQAEHGRRQRVFCASLADWLDNQARIEWLVDLLELVRITTDLDWLLLTKRIGALGQRLRDAIVAALAMGRDDLAAWISAWLAGDAPAHVWIGATVCNQAEADRDIPKLLATPARVRFLSIEPMLGPVNLRRFPMWQEDAVVEIGQQDFGVYIDSLRGYETARSATKIDWVICGGESGPRARPMHPDWARSLRHQCDAAGVAFMLKQWGEFTPTTITRQEFMQPAPAHVGELVAQPGGVWSGFMDSEHGVVMRRAGKKAAGRLLDGREHHGFPEVSR